MGSSPISEGASGGNGASTGLDALRTVIGEGILVAGGTRAILLQVAHPAVARAVSEHSHFGDRPLERLRATLTYVYGVAFGSPEEVALVRRTVDAAHEGVTGAGYDARDPELQLWVAATLYDTAVAIYERIFGALDETFAADLLRQYAVLGTALQVPPSTWFPDRTAFTTYWADCLTHLDVTPEARSIAEELVSPGPLALRALAPANRLLTAGLLPASLREGYGMAWDGRRQRMFDSVMGALALFYPRLPRRLRGLPSAYYLRDLRRRLPAGPPAATGDRT